MSMWPRLVYRVLHLYSMEPFTCTGKLHDKQCRGLIHGVPLHIYTVCSLRNAWTEAWHQVTIGREFDWHQISCRSALLRFRPNNWFDMIFFRALLSRVLWPACKLQRRSPSFIWLGRWITCVYICGCGQEMGCAMSHVAHFVLFLVLSRLDLF